LPRCARNDIIAALRSHLSDLRLSEGSRFSGIRWGQPHPTGSALCVLASLRENWSWLRPPAGLGPSCYSWLKKALECWNIGILESGGPGRLRLPILPLFPSRLALPAEAGDGWGKAVGGAHPTGLRQRGSDGPSSVLRPPPSLCPRCPLGLKSSSQLTVPSSQRLPRFARNDMLRK